MPSMPAPDEMKIVYTDQTPPSRGGKNLNPPMTSISPFKWDKGEDGG